MVPERNSLPSTALGARHDYFAYIFHGVKCVAEIAQCPDFLRVRPGEA
jgi:hypothetical protein